VCQGWLIVRSLCVLEAYVVLLVEAFLLLYVSWGTRSVLCVVSFLYLKGPVRDIVGSVL